MPDAALPPILAGLVLGAVLAGAVGLSADRLGRRLGLLDIPDPVGGRKVHTRITPLVGGIGVLAATLAGLLLPGVATGLATGWFGLVVAGMFLVGLADDRFELSAPFRFLFAAGFLLLAILQVPDFRLSFLLFHGQDRLVLLPGLLGIAFSLVCLLGFLNAVNMADGKNGLVIGQALVWTVVLVIRLPLEQAPLMAALGGALAILFLFNMQGRLFLGDSGSYCISATYGLLAIHAWNNGFDRMCADDIAVIFALPVFDTLRLIVHRVAAGRTPFTPGRDHLHHYLYERWGWPRPLPWVLALVVVTNAGTLLWPGTALVWLLVAFMGYLALLWAARRGLRPAVRPTGGG
ncbi:MAG: MraY family glycosyltransferase [Thermaurantiacus sp.]|uniref:glycosyltransferase family 4 protein n=1 Tax=Thermaurantiacus sp. TaxID=2820283 RepID=UPI00298F0753|nr:MraY family glycosyltransferase [Thermaurantiacus sp.]MDW8415409.1 MraY family glycosyltransferase [Thermaurantiacus sp.]